MIEKTAFWSRTSIIVRGVVKLFFVFLAYLFA